MKEAGKVRKLWSKRAEFAETNNDMGAYFRERERERGERNKKFVCLERKREKEREKKEEGFSYWKVRLDVFSSAFIYSTTPAFFLSSHIFLLILFFKLALYIFVLLKFI